MKQKRHIDQHENHKNDHDNQKHELLRQKVIVNHMISMTKTCALDL